MATWTLPKALQLLHSQYPGAFVTSGARDPNSALGRANPRSYHNIGEAFDIRPMQGVDFNTYVSKLKSAGLPVVEALDEATNPKPWTTGPNWHIAFSGDRKVATSPIDMLRRAQGFNIDIPSDAPPQDQSAQPTATPTTPAFDIQKALSGLMLTDDTPKQSKRGSTWAAILGAISDGLLAMGGQQPMYAPMALKQREDELDRNAAREKLNAEIKMKGASLLQKLMEPPQYIQNAQAWQALTPEQKRAVLQQQDAVNPITVSTPMGTQAVPRTSTKVIDGKTYYQIGGQWYEEGE